VAAAALQRADWKIAAAPQSPTRASPRHRKRLLVHCVAHARDIEEMRRWRARDDTASILAFVGEGAPGRTFEQKLTRTLLAGADIAVIDTGEWVELYEVIRAAAVLSGGARCGEEATMSAFSRALENSRR
jgi:hypothetical protein